MRIRLTNTIKKIWDDQSSTFPLPTWPDAPAKRSWDVEFEGFENGAGMPAAQEASKPGQSLRRRLFEDRQDPLPTSNGGGPGEVRSRFSL
jgi:hypothetical protein